jgi:hypothetical protein
MRQEGTVAYLLWLDLDLADFVDVESKVRLDRGAA